MIRVIACIMAITLTVAPTHAAQSSATEQTLEITHESLLGAIKTGGLTMAQPLIHPNALGFFSGSMNVVELGSSYGPADALPSVLTDLGRFNNFVFETRYRVIGNTGVVCMTTNLQPKKGQKAAARSTRSTYVYVHVNGNWRLLSWHTSIIPVKK